MAGEAIVGGIAAINPLLDYLRPRRSPYLIPVWVSAILIARYVGGSDGGGPRNLDTDTLLLSLPLFVSMGVFVFLCTRYRDPSLDDIPEDESSKIVDEIDSQLKFARATGIAVAAFSLYYIWIHGLSSSATNIAVYIISILHLATFIIYMALYNFRTESEGRYSLFQVGAIMSTCLLVCALSSPQVSVDDGEWLTNCQTTFTYNYSGKGLLYDSFGEIVDITGQDDLDVLADYSGSYTQQSEGCVPKAPPLSRGQALVYEQTYEPVGIPSQGPTLRYMDATLAIFAVFAVFWVYLEAFWIKLLMSGIAKSISVLDAPPNRARRPGRPAKPT